MIIGITGTIGAGKGTIVEFLKQKNFKHYSVRKFLNDELMKKGLPLNRNNQVMIANQIRESNSPSYIIEKLFEKAEQDDTSAVIESIRTPAEAELIKKKNGILIAVDANAQLRYSRIIIRQSETDNISFEEFLEHEKREMNSINPNHQNISICIKMADFILENNKDIQNLQRQVEGILQKAKVVQKEHKEETKKYTRLSWDEYFMKVTCVIAERSTCLRHNIGAIIVKNKRILTTGYNGAVKGGEDCLTLGCKKDEMNIGSGVGASEVCRAVHAEQNAIIQAALHGINTEGSTLYCTTVPCRMCAKEIINAGIKKVVTYSDYAGAFDSVEFLKKHGVEFEKIPRPKDKIKFKD
jgi:dCMP deaminase